MVSEESSETSRKFKIEKKEQILGQRNQVVDQSIQDREMRSENLKWNKVEKIFLNRYMFHKNQ